MSGYTKLFSSIVGSTIWREDSHTRVVWVTMLALADQDGVVEASVPGLADMARVTVEQAQVALAKFMAPDEFSRTPEHEGRRIEPVDGGWQILNHGKYREKLSVEYRKTRNRLRQQKHRARSDGDNPVTQKRDESVTRCDASRLSRQAEAEAEAEINTTPSADFDGSEWALRTFKAYPTWGDPDATVIPARLGDAYMQTIESEAPSRGGLIKTAQWFLEVTQEFARQSAGKEQQFIMGLEKFIRQGYAEVKMPSRATASRYIPAESDEECEKRLRAEARDRRSAAQEAIAG
jgi:hypothetical protein